MTKRILFLSLLLTLISCSKDFQIEGKWTINSQEVLNERPLPATDGPIDIVDFFGPTAWSQCEGKYFEFRDKGEVHTNMFPDEEIQKLNFKYQFDFKNRNLTFSAQHPIYGDEIQMMHKVEVVSNSEMNWIIGEYLKIQLEKSE